MSYLDYVFIGFQNQMCSLSAKGAKWGACQRIGSKVLPTLTESEPQEKGTHELVLEKLPISKGGLSAATRP